MKINLFFEKGILEKPDKLVGFLKNKSSNIQFELIKVDLTLNSEFISFPESHAELYDQLPEKNKKDKYNFFFTSKQYVNNYFFEGYYNFVPFSFNDWEYITDLPVENGIVFFIVEYLILQLDSSEFRHKENTGCIFDFHWDKSGVDSGMRLAGLCPDCLKRLEHVLNSHDYKMVLEDLQTIMNLLSNSSKWNKSILESFETTQKRTPKKRKSIKNKEISVTIASPSDLIEERKILLNELERKFRVDRHENNLGFRLIVHGWEDIASQNGYPQDVINEKIIEKSDIVLAIFKHRLGNPTVDNAGKKRADSGTVEEFLYTLDESNASAPLGMIYFYSKAPEISLDSPDFDKIKEDWEKVKEFRNSLKDKVIFKPYSDKSKLLDTVINELVKNIEDYFE